MCRLYARVMLIRYAHDDAEIEFVTDNKGVSDKFNAGPQAASVSANCYLFYELFKLLRTKHIGLRVRWMPSHITSTDVLPLGVTPLDVKGNAFADEYAKISAGQVQVSLQVSTDCVYYYALVKKIQKRIIYIIQN